MAQSKSNSIANQLRATLLNSGAVTGSTDLQPSAFKSTDKQASQAAAIAARRADLRIVPTVSTVRAKK